MAVNLDIDIDLGTKYLTNISAYFLGAIFASDEFVIKDGRKFWVAPVRHNKNMVSNIDIEQHYNNIRTLARDINKTTIMAELINSNGLNTGKFTSRMVGFGTFFESSINLQLEDLIESVRAALFSSTKLIQQCFLIGMFDGRGYFDINSENAKVRYVAIDCANPNLGNFLCEVISNYGMEYNYNESRERKEGGRPRKNQVRIKGAEKFQENIGFISSQKINQVYNLYDKNLYEIRNVDDILIGLKQIRRK